MPNGANKRQATRITITHGAEIGTGLEDIVATRTRDLSLMGVYVCAPNTFPPGTECGVRIMLGPDVVSGMVVHARGHVVRTDPDGMAIAFTEIADTDSFDHLQNLVLSHANDEDVIKRELLKLRDILPGTRGPGSNN